MERDELTDWESTYQKISEVLNKARNTVWQAVNTAMITAYWEIGKLIVEKEQQGKERAKYGENLLANLSQRLAKEFGKGFDLTNLRRMRAFYLAYPNRDSLRLDLSWTHYRFLLRHETTRIPARVGEGIFICW